WARGPPGSAADAGSGIHGAVSGFLANEVGIAIGCIARGDGDVAAGGDDAVEGAAIDDQVLDQREGGGAPGLDDQFFAIFEMAHGQLTDGGGAMGAVGDSVDHKTAGP